MTAEWLVSVAMLLLLGGFVALIALVGIGMVAEALRRKSPRDMRNEGTGRDHEADWP